MPDTGNINMNKIPSSLPSRLFIFDLGRNIPILLIQNGKCHGKDN
jgi:hypothetical protein